MGKKSISLTFSAAILLLLLLTTSPLLFNVIPVQAQSSGVSIRTTEPADGTIICSGTSAELTFDAQGTASSSDSQPMKITNGTFQVTSRQDGQILYSGKIHDGTFTSNSGGGSLALFYRVDRVPNSGSICVSTDDLLGIYTSCSTSDDNPVSANTGTEGKFGDFYGGVECSGGGGTTQSSSSMAGSSQDTDGDGDSDDDDDGLSDASDNCPNNPYLRCYNEGTTTVVVHSSR